MRRAGQIAQAVLGLLRKAGTRRGPRVLVMERDGRLREAQN